MVEGVKNEREVMLNKKVLIAYNRTTIFITKDFRKVGDNYLQLINEREDMKVNNSFIVYINQNKEKDMYKVAMRTPALIKGTVINMSSKFITVKVYDARANDYYEYILPLRSIEGIKILSYEDDENEL